MIAAAKCGPDANRADLIQAARDACRQAHPCRRTAIFESVSMSHGYTGRMPYIARDEVDGGASNSMLIELQTAFADGYAVPEHCECAGADDSVGAA